MTRDDLYLAEGYGSLFVYCTRCLHLSEHAAYGGIEAARAARQFPVILELLSDGSVTLTTVCLLARHLTAVFQNVYELRLPPNRMAILRPQWTTWHGTICARRDTRNTSAKTVNGDGHLNVIMES